MVDMANIDAPVDEKRSVERPKSPAPAIANGGPDPPETE